MRPLYNPLFTNSSHLTNRYSSIQCLTDSRSFTLLVQQSTSAKACDIFLFTLYWLIYIAGDGLGYALEFQSHFSSWQFGLESESDSVHRVVTFESNQNSLTIPWHESNGRNSLTFFQNSMTFPWPGENFVFPWHFADTWQPCVQCENFCTVQCSH